MQHLLLALLIIPRLGIGAPVVPGEIATSDPEHVTLYKTNWIVAHNNLMGDHFDELRVGDRIYYQHTVYVVEDLVRFRATDPLDPAAPLVRNGQAYSPYEVRNMVTCLDCLTLQTCIRNGGDWAWGRLFVIARKEGVNHAP